MTNAGILVPPPADARVVVSSFVTAGCDQFVAPEEIEGGYLSPQLKMAIGWEKTISAEESWSRLRPVMTRMKDFTVMMRHEFPKHRCGERYNFATQTRFNLPDDSRLWKISHYSEGQQIKKIVVPVDCSGNYSIEDLTELARGILVFPRDEERCQRKRSPTLGEVWMCFRYDNSTRLLRDRPGLTRRQKESIGKPPGKDFEWFYKTRTLQLYHNIYHGDECKSCEPVGIMISMSSSIRYIDPRLHTISPYETEKQPGGFLFDQRQDSLHPNKSGEEDEVPQPLGCNRSKARCFDLLSEREWATAMDIPILVHETKVRVVPSVMDSGLCSDRNQNQFGVSYRFDANQVDGLQRGKARGDSFAEVTALPEDVGDVLKITANGSGLVIGRMLPGMIDKAVINYVLPPLRGYGEKRVLRIMRDAVEYQNVTPTGYVLIVTDDLKLPGLAQPFDMVEVHNGEIRLLKPEKLFSGKYRPWCEEDNTNASDQSWRKRLPCCDKLVLGTIVFCESCKAVMCYAEKAAQPEMYMAALGLTFAVPNDSEVHPCYQNLAKCLFRAEKQMGNLGRYTKSENRKKESDWQMTVPAPLSGGPPISCSAADFRRATNSVNDDNARSVESELRAEWKKRMHTYNSGCCAAGKQDAVLVTVGAQMPERGVLQMAIEGYDPTTRKKGVFMPWCAYRITGTSRIMNFIEYIDTRYAQEWNDAQIAQDEQVERFITHETTPLNAFGLHVTSSDTDDSFYARVANQNIFNELNPVPEYSKRMTVAIIEAYDAHRFCTPRHLFFLTDPYLTNKEFTPDQQEQNKELLLKWILKKIFRCSNTRDVGGRTYLLRQVQNESNSPSARIRAFDEVVDCLAHIALGEESSMEERQKVQTKIMQLGEERQQLIYRRYLAAESHQGFRDTNDYANGHKDHVTVNGKRLRVRSNYELGNYVRGVTTLTVPWCVNGENVYINVLMEVSSYYFDMPSISMIGLILMILVTISALWIGKRWVTTQFQLLQDEPDIDIWEYSDRQPEQVTQGSVAESVNGSLNEQSDDYEYESVVTSRPGSSDADVNQPDPWLAFQPEPDEDVWQEAERLASFALAKAKARLQTVPAKYGSQQAPARWTDFAPAEDELPKANPVTWPQTIGPPPPKMLPYPLPQPPLTGDQVEQFFAPMVAADPPMQMKMPMPKPVPKIVFSTHAQNKAIPATNPHLLYTAPKKAPPPMKAVPMKAVMRYPKTVAFPAHTPSANTNPDALSYPDPLVFINLPEVRVPNVCKICRRASTHSQMVRCYDCAEEVCPQCATHTNEVRFGSTRMSCRNCYILEQRMIIGISARHTVDAPEDHVGVETELVFDNQNMAVVLAYYDMFTLHQMQALFDLYGITMRADNNKFKACIQYHRATLDRDNMPTAYQLQTIRGIATGQEPKVMPFEVATYQRCAVAIRMRTIEADPFDGRETIYTNIVDSDYTPALRLWLACFTAEPVHVNLNQMLYEEISDMDLHAEDIHREMVEYQHGADVARERLEAAIAANWPNGQLPD